MKARVLVSYLSAVVLGIAMSTGAVAQARHDDKPHGESGKLVKKSDVKKQPRGTGTRHDEKPHGTPKAEGDKK